MMDQAAVDRPAGMKRLLQRVEDKARRSGAAGPPAHDPSGIDVDDERDIRGPRIKASTALTLVSETPPEGSREAFWICTSVAFTKSPEVVPKAF